MKRAIQLAVSLGLCWALYHAADWHSVAAELARLDGPLLLLGLACFVPQTGLSAWRWRRLIATTAPLSLADSLRHTLAASALNLVVPSKLGDFSKAGFVASSQNVDRKRLAIWVAVEKTADLVMLFVAMLTGTQFGWAGAIVVFALFGATTLLRHRNRALTSCLAATIVLWVLHLAQIHCFLLAAGVPSTATMTAARVPAGLLAGIVPAAFCGIGTRDAAFVWLYTDVAPAATMAAVGMLTALRYLVPGAVGIPLLMALRRVPPTVIHSTTIAGEPSANRRPTLPSLESSSTH